MKSLPFRLTLCTALSLIALSAIAAEPAPTDKPADQNANTKPLRVGVYDSRGVALAYYRKYLRSPEFTAVMKKLKEDHDKAKAAGDTEKAKKLEAQGKGMQAHSHAQVFGAAPIDEVLAKIKDQLPQIAKQAGVDLIVCKWTVAYQAPNANMVDVTEPMAKLFQPDETTMKMIREASKHKPLSAEELKHVD
jgi:hypothetical protein